MSNEDKLINRLIHEYLDLNGVDSIEILCPYEEDTFAQKIRNELNDHKVFITYTNGLIAKEIEESYRIFLDKRIAFYKERIKEKFIRITILSPFSMPIPLTDNVSLYRDNIHELAFVNEYLLEAQRCMIVKPNTLWAHKLNITLDELWDKVNMLYEKDSILINKLDYINSIDIKSVHYETKEGTDVTFLIDKGNKFTGKYINIGNKRFVGNAPTLEIFTAPNKYSGNGRIIFTKPFFYRGKMITNHSITLRNGRIIENKGLDEILSIDESLSYIGEIAICESINYVFMNSLLDENTGCHIALGNGYLYNINDSSNINKSNYHYDLVFGSNSVCVSITDTCNNNIEIVKNGKVVI